MTTSASTTFSPSRRSTTRSTPCVLGCCGPMLSTSSLVSNMAPWWMVGVSMRSLSCLGASVLGFVGPPKHPGTHEPKHRHLLDICLVSCLPQLQPVDRILHEQFARTLERIVLALRESLPVLRHQDAPPVGMSGEIHAEH